MTRGRPRIHPHSTHELRWTPSNQQLVWALLHQYPEVKAGGFVPALETAFPELFDDMRWFRRVPDGYTIRPEEREVDLFEIEVTHAIPRSTLLDLGKLRLELDNLDIRLDCCIVNRYGHINQLDLGFWYLQVGFGNGELANSEGSGAEDTEVNATVPGEDSEPAGIPGSG